MGGRVKRFLWFIGRALFLLIFLLASSVIFVPQSFGIKVHEYAATAFLVAAIYHVIRNRYVFRKLFAEKYPYYLLRDLTAVLIITAFLIMLLTGMAISVYVFDFIRSPFQGILRDIHLYCAVYSFVLVGIHIGLHAISLFSFIRQQLGKRAVLMVKLFLTAAAVHGFYVFITGDYLDRLLFRQTFAFFDYERPIIFSLIDTGSALVMFAALGYGLAYLCLTGFRR